jgi:biotin transport system substrate-specific component
MHSSPQTLIPHFLTSNKQQARSQNTAWVLEFFTFLGGVGLLAALAQIAVPLSFSPVPLTGQTFGIVLCGLLWGQKRALMISGSYLFLGLTGLPIFAHAQAAHWGPTAGYLIGMLLASGLIGFLADRGFAQTFWKAYLAASLGSLLIFSCGLVVLSFFIPKTDLLVAGLLPFLPGDLLKNSLAALISSRIYSAAESKK